ncbi:MAG: sensor histidine kinase [Flavisolibacter sp.]
MKTKETNINIEELLQEMDNLRMQLNEAHETIEAIRTGQVDALVVQGTDGHQLYTLKSADQTYRVFIEKMTEGALTLNQKGLILYSNSQFASMVGSSLSKVIGLSFENFVPNENIAEYRKLFENGWDHDVKGEFQLKRDHTQIPVQLSLTTLELEEGRALSIIITDLTMQKNTQQQLRDNYIELEKINSALESSNHDLQQFASIASHDLQEPLRKIQIFSSMMQDRCGDLSTEAQLYLKKIVESSARMKSLIIDILNYSKLSANDGSMQPVDLNEILRELQDDFELIIAERKAEFVTDTLPTIEANRGQVRQVFQNIISNALKFVRPGVPPEIHILCKRISEKSFNSESSADGAYYKICIRDNGIGFNEKYVNNIFSLFERLNSKDKYEGTGIGLAIAKKIIDKHNGLITAISTEGSGAEFQIILPEK